MSKQRAWPITGYAMQTIAGTEADFQIEYRYPKQKPSRWARCIDKRSAQTVAAALCGVIDRALRMANFSQKPFALCLASNFFELAFQEDDLQYAQTSGRAQGQYLPWLLRRLYPIEGPVLLHSTACASGANALIGACQLLEDGRADAVLVLAYELETRSAENGMRTLGALSKEGLAPFSQCRSGTELAEGIGAVLLEKPDAAREARAWLRGYAVKSDAYNVTTQNPSGEALVQAMREALQRADVPPEAVRYVSAHGSGTQANDALETRAIKEVFGAHAHALYVNASKSIIGHTMGAAGLLEAALAVWQMNRGIVHPTANFGGFDPNCDLQHCFQGPVRQALRFALSNSIGFGGTNTSLVLENGVGYA